jgi:hypothetical protein
MPDNMGRRAFLTTGAALGLGARGVALSADEFQGNAYAEPARKVPIVGRADVVVCGAGPAGVAAAIAAARAGAKTQLLEANGCLGGVWTAGLLSWILDCANKPGLMKEILAKLDARRTAAHYGSSVGYDVEDMKLLLEELCVAAKVGVRLHTRVAGAVRDAAGRLRLAITESKSGREAWAGRVFIDATGDGDLAAQAGCGFDYGRPGSGETQPMSMLALLTGLKLDEVRPFVIALERRQKPTPKERLLAEMQRAGVDPSYAHPSLFYTHEALYCLMANHEYGVSALDAGAISAATMRARAEVHKLVGALRKLGGPWAKVQIVATAEHIGVREGRRVHGLYQVSTDDLIRGARHDDAVCRVTFPVDIHSTDPRRTKAIMTDGVKAKPYDIPYRALIARDVKGLLLAGRLISGDFVAHSSYRVTGNSVAMGEAAGVAAALAAKGNQLPQDVSWSTIAACLNAVAK